MTELSSKELIKAGHAFAENLDADMPLVEMAKLVSALATRLDVELTRNAEMQKQSEARGEIVERLIGQYCAAGYHAVQNSLNPAQSLLYDAMQVVKPDSTTAVQVGV
jgi:hypothetical protein